MVDRDVFVDELADWINSWRESHSISKTGKLTTDQA